MPLTSVVIDTVNFGEQGPSGPQGGQTCQNKFMFESFGFLYQVYHDNDLGTLPASTAIGIWKSNLDGSNAVRMDVANQPNSDSGFVMGACSLEGSPFIDIVFSAGNNGFGSANIYVISFDTTPGVDAYTSVSTALSSGNAFALNVGSGVGIFRRANGDIYFVTGSDQASGSSRLTFYKLSAGVWSAATEMLPAGATNNCNFLNGLVHDQVSGFVYMIMYLPNYVTGAGIGWEAFIWLDDTDTPGTLTVFDTGTIQYLYDTDRVDLKIIADKLCGVWCDFDPTTFVPRANYLEISPLNSPSSFVNTNIWTDTDTSNNIEARDGAIGLSNGDSFTLGTSGFLATPPPPFPQGYPGNMAGLILPNAPAPAVNVTCAFWIKDSQSLSPEFVAQIWGSTLVSGVWSTPTIIYDFVTNPPAGYTAGNHHEGPLERLQALPVRVCSGPVSASLYAAKK